MAEDGQNGDENGESIDAKAQDLMNAYNFLFNVTDVRGRHFQEAMIRQVYNRIVHDSDMPITVVMRDRQPHFTQTDMRRIEKAYGLRYQDHPRTPGYPSGYTQLGTTHTASF